MKREDRLRKLQSQKEELSKALSELDLAFHSGLVNKLQYLERKREILNWKFEEDIHQEIDDEIAKLSSRKKTIPIVALVVLLFGVMIPFIQFDGITDGITSLVISDPTVSSSIKIMENYSDNSTKNLSYITASSLKVNGKIYGYGEAWIYLVNGLDKKLVYYADTSSLQSITGLVVGTGNESNNATAVNDTNETAPVFVNMTNETNSTNETINQTNSTANETNTTANETNSTVNETNTTSVVVDPEIIISKNTYYVGERIDITLLPDDPLATVYIHAPDDSYILNELYWVAEVPGTHTITTLTTIDGEFVRISTDFEVIEDNRAVSSFTEACVETCSMANTPVHLEIVLRNTRIELESVSFTGTVENGTNITATPGKNTTNVTPPRAPGTAPDPRELIRNCVQGNPNLRPGMCFSEEQKEEFFPDRTYTLVNNLGMRVAEIDKDGNMQIRGSLIENAIGDPQEFDFVVKGNGITSAWIDVVTGDLYLRGSVQLYQDTMMWSSRADYVISNDAGIYLAIFNGNVGDLYLRGNVIQGGLA